jgi:hypothetical protein
MLVNAQLLDGQDLKLLDPFLTEEGHHNLLM